MVKDVEINKKGKINNRLQGRFKKEKIGDIIVKKPYNFWYQIDTLFRDFQSELKNLLWLEQDETPLENHVLMKPHVLDVEDTEKNYELTVDLPGILKHNIDLEVTPTKIKIAAEQEGSSKNTGRNWLFKERNERQFYRCVDFPEEIKTDEVDAELDQGVLTVHLPKRKPKSIYKPKKVVINNFIFV
jgi:HSP20 family protein